MNTESKRRRKSLARPWLLVLALLVVGVAYSAVIPQTSSADTEMTQQIAEGKAIFDVSCSSCHGLNGEGQTTGPSLIGVGAASVDFQMGTGRMPAARAEAQIPVREVQYSQEQIDAVAAYVATFGPGPAVPEASQYEPGGLSEEEIARGGAMPEGKYAPSLANTEDVHIYEAIRTGPQQMPMFSKDVLEDDDVRQIIGYLNEASEQPQYGGLGMGNNGPVSEGLWIFLLGIGGLSLVAFWIAKNGARTR